MERDGKGGEIEWIIGSKGKREDEERIEVNERWDRQEERKELEGRGIEKSKYGGFGGGTQ